MSKKITVEPNRVWWYFQTNQFALGSSMHQIAENDEYGVSIFVTGDITGDFPVISVFADDVQVYETTVYDEIDCADVVENVYENYLTSKVVESIGASEVDDGEPGLSCLDIEDMIDDRETELNGAIRDFLTTVVQGHLSKAEYTEMLCDYDDIVDDLKEHFLEYMARKHNIPIFRPMFLEYEDGTEEFERFPYPHMDFEDENNPIYKKSKKQSV